MLVNGLLQLFGNGQIGQEQLRDIVTPLQIRGAALFDVGRPKIDVAVHVLGHRLILAFCKVVDVQR